MVRRRKRLLKSGEKILFHLEELGRFEGEGEAPYPVTQNGIADRVGLQRSHVPRVLKSLLAGRLVEERLAHIKGGGRSRHVYFLTWEGAQAARELRTRFGGKRVQAVLPDGAERRIRIRDAAAALGVKAGPLEIALAAERGPITALALSGQAMPEGFVEALQRAPVPRPFFGREKELELLSGWLREGSRLVCLTGPSGMGKTSTGLRLLAGLRGRGHLLWISLHEWDSLQSFLLPIADFLARTGRRKLSACLAGTTVIDIAVLAELLGSELEELGAVIFIDDIERAGEEAMKGVRLLAGEVLARPGPRLVVMGRHSGRMRALGPPAGWASGQARMLALEGLDDASAAKLAISAPERQKEVLAAAGGCPLYLEYLSLGGLEEGRILVREHLGREVLSGLGKAERRLLQRAAVYGRPAPAAALLKDGRDRPALGLLLEQNLLFRRGEGLLDMHELLRDLILSELSDRERAKLHLEAARHLIGSNDPSSILYALRHLLGAGDRTGAASTAAARGQGLVEAGYGRPLLHEVLAHLGPSDAGKRWPALLSLRAGVLASEGERDRALKDFRELVRMGGPFSAGACLGMGQIFEERSDWAGAARAYRDASRSSDLWPAALRGEARVAWRRGEWAAAWRKFAQALRLAGRRGQRSLTASILTDMGNLEDDRGFREKALRLYERALRLLETEGALLEQARVHNNIGAVLFYGDRWDEALEHYHESLALSERCGEPSIGAYALSNIGQVLARRGEEARAQKYLDASTETFERLGDGFMVSSNLLARGILYRMLRDWERSEDFFKRGLEMLKRLGMPREMAEARFEHGLALRDMGRPGKAKAELAAARRQFASLGATREKRKAERELKRLR